MTKEIRIGVIGAENRGALARKAHQPAEGVRLVAGCTLKPENLLPLKEKFGPDFFITGDYRELLKQDIDAVFICTPDFLHEEHALAAIEAGKHIYLEKPVSISVESCDRILDAAARRGVKLYVGHNMRFFDVMKKMKEIIDSGGIGAVQSIWCRHFVAYGGDCYFRDWHSERQFTHGLLLQKGAHDIDVIHWLAGAYTTRVTGMGKLSVYDKLPRRAPGEPTPPVGDDRSHWPPKATGNYSPKIDIEDSSMILMQLQNGVQACYLQSHYTPDTVRNYTVIGTEGRIENFGDTSSDEGIAHVHLWNHRTSYKEHGQEIFEIPISRFDDGHGGSDGQIVRDFIRFLRGEKTAGPSPWDARMSVATGYYGTESLRSGNIPFDVPQESTVGSKKAFLRTSSQIPISRD